VQFERLTLENKLDHMVLIGYGIEFKLVGYGLG
jgi:hypothetical protein